MLACGHQPLHSGLIKFCSFTKQKETEPNRKTYNHAIRRGGAGLARIERNRTANQDSVNRLQVSAYNIISIMAVYTILYPLWQCIQYYIHYGSVYNTISTMAVYTILQCIHCGQHWLLNKGDVCVLEEKDTREQVTIKMLCLIEKETCTICMVSCALQIRQSGIST
jgi:hypothetical protein